MAGDDLKRRDFLKYTGAALGASMAGSLFAPGTAYAATPGGPVRRVSLTTADASFDPVRPEMGRVISRAAKDIGWAIDLNAENYNQGIQQVIMEHKFDMFIVRLTGQANRIDPNVFLYKLNDSSQYYKGGWNWCGFSNPQVDHLVRAQQTQMNIEKRREIVLEAQKAVFEHHPHSAIIYPGMTQAYRSDRLRGLVPMMGEGIGSFWSDVNVETISGDPYVRTGATVTLKSLNPLAANDANEFKELRMIYDRLAEIGPDGKVKLWAAKSIDVVDPTTIDIAIKPGMTFHDGKPVTARDIKFTFDYHKKWNAPYFVETLKRLASVTITGTHSLRIKLTSPYAPLGSNLFASIFILPEHIWKDIPEKAKVDDALKYPNSHPIGSGPFKFNHWYRGSELKVSAFKECHNPPKCAGILRITYGSNQAMAAAIQRGECDRTRYILEPSLMQNLAKVPHVVAKAYPSHGFYQLAYHDTEAPFSDPAFRKAFEYVIPKEVIRDAIMSGYAHIGASVIAPVNKFWHNPEVKPYPHDPTKARAILSAAGYTWDSSGRLHYPKA